MAVLGAIIVAGGYRPPKHHHARTLCLFAQSCASLIVSKNCTDADRLVHTGGCKGKKGGARCYLSCAGTRLWAYLAFPPHAHGIAGTGRTHACQAVAHGLLLGNLAYGSVAMRLV